MKVAIIVPHLKVGILSYWLRFWLVNRSQFNMTLIDELVLRINEELRYEVDKIEVDHAIHHIVLSRYLKGNCVITVEYYKETTDEGGSSKDTSEEG